MPQPLTVIGVFQDADIVSQFVMLCLVAASIAAIVIGAMKVSSGPHLAGGSAFLSSLRLGGPIIGAFGASYVVLNIFMGVSNVSYPVTLKIVAPGVAEAAFLLGLGLLSGVVAVIANWAVEARIDRAVLRA